MAAAKLKISRHVDVPGAASTVDRVQKEVTKVPTTITTVFVSDGQRVLSHGSNSFASRVATSRGTVPSVAAIIRPTVHLDVETLFQKFSTILRMRVQSRFTKLVKRQFFTRCPSGTPAKQQWASHSQCLRNLTSSKNRISSLVAWSGVNLNVLSVFAGHEHAPVVQEGIRKLTGAQNITLTEMDVAT